MDHGNKKEGGMGINAYHRAELKGIRTTTCPDCDGAALEGDSGEGWWEQSDCEKCHGTGDFYACHECGENEADCDDYCHVCRADMYISGEEDIEQDLEIFHDIWTLPGYAKCLELVNAAKSAKDAK